MFLGKIKPKPISLDDAYYLSHRYADKFSIYHITYEDLKIDLQRPYSTLTKLMSKWVQDGDYLKEKYGHEAHFIHPDYRHEYLESKKDINFNQDEQSDSTLSSLHKETSTCAYTS